MHNFTTRGAVVEIVPSEASFHFQLRSSFWSSFENLNIILFKSTFKEIPSPFVFSGLLPHDKLQKIVLQVSAWNFLHTLDLILYGSWQHRAFNPPQITCYPILPTEQLNCPSVLPTSTRGSRLHDNRRSQRMSRLFLVRRCLESECRSWRVTVA